VAVALELSAVLQRQKLANRQRQRTKVIRHDRPARHITCVSRELRDV
jgi:hypothetical protein